MPQVTFHVRWPDGAVDDCYSPSLVVEELLEARVDYPVTEFVERSTRALAVGSERVAQKLGFACTAAAATSDRIVARAATYAPDALVRVEGFTR